MALFGSVKNFFVALFALACNVQNWKCLLIWQTTVIQTLSDAVHARQTCRFSGLSIEEAFQTRENKRKFLCAQQQKPRFE